MTDNAGKSSELTALACPAFLLDHGRLTDHEPATPRTSSRKNERGYVVEVVQGEREGVLPHSSGERHPRLPLALEDHTGIRLTGKSEQLAMPELNVYEALLAAPDMKAVVLRLQIMQQMGSFVDHDIAVGVRGLIGRPAHMGKFSAGQAIAFNLESGWFEAIILKTRPEDLPGRLEPAGRQLCLQGRSGPLIVQDEGPSGKFAESDILPVTLHKALDHRFNALPNAFRIDRRDQLGVCWEESGQKAEEGPQGGFRRLAETLVLVKLGTCKTSGACSVPGLFAGAEKSFERRCRQSAIGRGLLRRLPDTLIYWSFNFPPHRPHCQPPRFD